MPGAALVGAALNPGTTRSKGLWVGGVDVIKDPLGPTTNFGVPIGSVVVDHMGPGGVSSMEFDIEVPQSPQGFVRVADGMDVRFYDFTRGYPIFTGWVDHVDIQNMEGDNGTVFHVIATGIEAVLDWSVLTADLTIASGTAQHAAVQSVFANCTGTSLNRIRALADSTISSVSTDNLPIENTNAFTVAAVTIPSGTTLRQAISMAAGVVDLYPEAGVPAAVMKTTIDWLGGLRFMLQITLPDINAVTVDAAWNWPTVDNDSGGVFMAGADTILGIDAASVRGVFVKGTGASAYVSDGTGKEGAVAVLDASSATTTAACIQAGTNYLASYLTTVRGSLVWEDQSTMLTVERHPGGAMPILSDVRLNLTDAFFVVTEVVKTFNPSGRENWTVSFGGFAPSVTGLTRQLTRTQLS